MFVSNLTQLNTNYDTLLEIRQDVVTLVSKSALKILND